MAKFAELGVCPRCLVAVYKGQELSMIINAEPLPTDQVIPALKARTILFRRIPTPIKTLLTWADPLWLARDLKAGGALPSNIHALHEHQQFSLEEDMPKKIVHWDRGVRAPACSQAGYLLETSRNPRQVTCKKCINLVPAEALIPEPEAPVPPPF